MKIHVSEFVAQVSPQKHGLDISFHSSFEFHFVIGHITGVMQNWPVCALCEWLRKLVVFFFFFLKRVNAELLIKGSKLVGRGNSSQ